MQTLYMPNEASKMVETMCKRVDLSLRAGGYILAMSRLHRRLPGGLIDMAEIARVIKYASENQADLKPHFRMDSGQNTATPEPEKPANFTFLK